MIQKATNPTAGHVDLCELAEKITSRAELVAFLRELLADRHRQPDRWEHRTIDSYLEAVIAWTEDMDGFYLNQGEPVPTSPTWRTIAHTLLAARVYE